MESTPNTPEKKNLSCPRCGATGKPIGEVTLRSLVRENIGDRIGKKTYRFCPSAGCDVVYFADRDGKVFVKSDLKVRVGMKEKESPRPVCYCFGYSMEDIEREVAETGTSIIPRLITEKCRQGLDRCEETNPQGSCCLGNVHRVLKEAQERAGIVPGPMSPEPECCSEGGDPCCVDEMEGDPSVKATRKRGFYLATGGTILSAVLSSACCWLPLLLVAFGVSGVAVSSTLNEYRPLFITLTFVFLGTAFYLTYRPQIWRLFPQGRTGTDSKGSGCCHLSEETGCCDSEKKRRLFSVRSFNKISLWVATVFALSFVFFPNTIGLVRGVSPGAEITAPESRGTFFRVEGMTCAGCAAAVKESIETVPSVRKARVYLKEGLAEVVFDQRKPAPVERVLRAISDAGYRGQFLGSRPGPANRDFRR